MRDTRLLLATFLMVILFLSLMSATLGCGVIGGKPSTSAPGGSNPAEILEACSEREGEIDAWEESQKEQVEDDFADGKRNLLQSVVKQEDIEEEARDLRQELRDNCQKKVNNLLPPTTDDTKDEPFPTVTPRR